MGRKDYDPRLESTAMLAQLRDAISATESIAPAPPAKGAARRPAVG